MCVKTVEVWVPVFDWGLCAREFGFTVVGQPDKRRASIRRKVEELAKNAAATIVSECGLQVLEVLECGHMGYGSYPNSKNYLGVRVRAKVEIPEDVVACVEVLSRLSNEALRERVQVLYRFGDKHHTRRLDVSVALLGDWFKDGYCISWSAIYRQLGIQIRGLDRAYISQKEFLSLTKNGTVNDKVNDSISANRSRVSFLQHLKALFRR
jgi:hypothetical protein